ncbi:MAG: glycosyltransferase family 4 protein [Janthinobacterium lividum]
MRVLMLYQADKTGETEQGVLELCEHGNFDWTAALFAKASCKAKFESLGKPVEVIASKGFEALEQGAALQSVLGLATTARRVVNGLAKAAQSSDVVFMSGHSALAMAAGGLAGKIARRPVVWHVQDLMEERKVGKCERLALRAVSKWLVSGVICNSHAARKSFMSLMGTQFSDIEVIHPGVAAQKSSDAARYTKAEVRTMFGLPGDAYLLGCFDRLASRKGQHVVLEALAKDPDAHVLMLSAVLPGAESYANALKLKIRELGLSHRVHFVGQHADIPLLMQAVDVMVNASTLPDAFDRNVVAGMLAGLPVIASRIGGNPEIVQHMKSGILIKPEDAESLLRSLQMVRNNLPFAERLGKEAALRGATRFLPDSCLQSTNTFLRGYMQVGRRRTGWVMPRAITGGAEQVFAGNINTVK